jgi:hypothetical protein
MNSRHGNEQWRIGALVVSLVIATSFGGISAHAQDGDNGQEPWMAQAMSPTLKHYYLSEAIRSGRHKLRFDVVELGTKFAFDEAPVDENGLPGYGNPFITQGVIYPPGVIETDADGNTNGVIVETDAEGNTVARPEFPELVLGIWICRGTVFADEGFNIQSGPTVHSTQLYDFSNVGGDFGRISLESSGLELIDLNKQIARAVTGGTGPFKRSRGEMRQTFIGINASQGFSLRFESRLR